MTDAAPQRDGLPSPAGALERAFRAIELRQMRDMPMCNPALAVEAVGWRRWGDHWLGVLITPWFMNLMLMPCVGARWQAIGERQTRHYAFPAGVFEFIGGRDPVLGDYQACSLFSPMFEFADQAGARATALAALDALFDAAQRASADRPQHDAAASRPVTKRELLFGLPARADRGA